MYASLCWRYAIEDILYNATHSAKGLNLLSVCPHGWRFACTCAQKFIGFWSININPAVNAFTMVEPFCCKSAGRFAHRASSSLFTQQGKQSLCLPVCTASIVCSGALVDFEPQMVAAVWTDQTNIWLAATCAFALVVLTTVYKRLVTPSIPTLRVDLTEGDQSAVCTAQAQCSSLPCLSCMCCPAEAQDRITADKHVPGQASADQIPCYDPANMQQLGVLPAMTASEVRSCMSHATPSHITPSATSMLPQTKSKCCLTVL